MSILGTRVTRAFVLAGAAWTLGWVALLHLAGPPATGGPSTLTAAPPPLGLHGVRSLPAAAQSAISATLGASDGHFNARRSVAGWQLRGGGVSATFGDGRARLRTAGGTLSLSLAGPPVTSMTARGNRVTLERFGLREWYVAGPVGIEQGFTLVRRPVGTRHHELTLRVAVGGSLRLRSKGSEVAFEGSGHEIVARYGALTAVDATGHRLPATLRLRGRHMLITVNERGARYPITVDPLVQQGAKLTGGNESGPGSFGVSVALSADGNTALVGGDSDHANDGAAWAFTRSGGTWSQQGPKLTGGGPAAGFGKSVALSADGNTALIGADFGGSSGAALVFTRSGSTWTAQGGELTGAGATAGAGFGSSVALSADGNTALVGAPSNTGAVWAFARNNGTWSPLGLKLTATGESGSGQFGSSLALSADGVTALIGGNNDNAGKGAAWVFTLGAGGFAQQAMLTGDGEAGNAPAFGSSVALSADGNTALIGGPSDGIDAQLGQGAAWVFTRSQSIWSQQGSKLTGSDAGLSSGVGSGVALASDGNVALIGGQGDGGGTGAAWVFARSGSAWAQQGAKLTGQGENLVGRFGHSVALAADGQTALIGGNNDNGGAGAAWAFAPAAPGCSALSATAPAGGGAVSLALPCSGPAGAGLSYAVVSGPAHGSLGSVGTDGRVTYTSRSGYIGADTFSYRVSDAWGVSNTGIATITVPAFAAPVCSNVSAHGRKGATRVTLALSCHAPTGVRISFSIVTAPGDGKLSKINQSNGGVTYIAPVGFSGTDRFIYRAIDVGGASATATATIVLPKLDRITSTMTWGEFRAGPTATVMPGMLIKGLPGGAQVKLSCTKGCPIKAQTLTLGKHRVCKGRGKKRHCRLARPKSANLDLTRFAAHKRVKVGSQITVAMIQSGSLGKEYVFRIVKSNQPSVKIQTLAPGSTALCPGC